ncbi:type II toxin-antitoxin system VapC family toxin [Azospirillum sp.]|uniref:type II toxin-antitoxin system VapC family toxin n=1 Tax=Azospirillum sp. TaxID=34012 RepID=UPI003D756835
MSFVVDTNILSRTAPSQGDGGALADWLERNSDALYLSAVTLMEVQYGVARLRHRGATRKAALLEAWLDDVLTFYGDCILPVDPEVARRAGDLLALAQANGTEPGSEDALIAATADLRGMTVVTENVRHFAPMRVAVADPRDRLPGDA